MKAAFVKKYNKVKIVDIPRPSPTGGEILVKIDACGVCGSDFIEARAWAKQWKRFGHEIVGTVAEMAPEATGFSEGDQVVVVLSAACGICPSCAAGVPRKCSNMILLEQGGFAEYLLVHDQRLLYPVRPPLPIESVAMAEPLTVVLDAFEAASPQEGQYLLVVGGGFIGRLALLTAKAKGVRSAGILSRKSSPQVEACLNAVGGEYFEWRTRFGRTIGPPPDFERKLFETPGKLFVLHTAPGYYMGLYLDALPPGTSVVNIGLSARPRENRLSLDTDRLMFKRTQLLAAMPAPCLHMEQAVNLIQRHKELFASMPTEAKTLDELPGVINGSYSRGSKVLVVP